MNASKKLILGAGATLGLVAVLADQERAGLWLGGIAFLMITLFLMTPHEDERK